MKIVFQEFPSLNLDGEITLKRKKLTLQELKHWLATGPIIVTNDLDHFPRNSDLSLISDNLDNEALQLFKIRQQETARHTYDWPLPPGTQFLITENRGPFKVLSTAIDFELTEKEEIAEYFSDDTICYTWVLWEIVDTNHV
ncbi:MAG: hypothetical protein Q4G02_03975 [bacterium]|nr:hypothetical protein [bacterium]